MERGSCQVRDGGCWWGRWGGFDQRGKELLIDWASTASPALCQSPADPFSSALSFLPATSDRPFPERSVPSLRPHLTSLLWGWQPGSEGDKQHPSTLHGHRLLEPPFLPSSILNSPLGFPFFPLLLCGYSITVSAFVRHPPRRAHKCSSAALITVWQTTVEGWRQLLAPIPPSPNSTPRLSRQGHPAARDGECQAVNGGFHLPLLVSSQRLASTEMMPAVWFSTTWPGLSAGNNTWCDATNVYYSVWFVDFWCPMAIFSDFNTKNTTVSSAQFLIWGLKQHVIITLMLIMWITHLI